MILVQDKINSLIEKIDIDSFNIVKYDLLETESDDVIRFKTVAFDEKGHCYKLKHFNKGRQRCQ